MLLDQKYLFNTESEAQNDLLQSNFEQTLKKFSDCELKELRLAPPGFFSVLDEQKTLEEIAEFAKNQNKKHLILCGIGGSALGTKAVLAALGLSRKITILDTIDPEALAVVAESDLAENLFLFVSKSGDTLETVAQYFFFRTKLEAQKLPLGEHMVFITGEQGFLWETAKKDQIKTFSVPVAVGGRYSVLTAVGLLPLALAGVEIEKLLAGAKKARENVLSADTAKNLALRLAVAEFTLQKPVSVAFIFAEKLQYLGYFWRQLLAESIGKSEKIGILPHIALGTRDQHSDLQLFAEGPNDKLYTFIEDGGDYPLALPPIATTNFTRLSEKKFSDLRKASAEGTRRSLIEKYRPVQTLVIEKIDEETIGELIFTLEAAIAYLGYLFKIDPFNQPGVERGKKITTEILQK